MLIIEECTKCEIQNKIKALFLYFKKIPKGKSEFEKYKWTNNDPQNIHMKLRIE